MKKVALMLDNKEVLRDVNIANDINKAIDELDISDDEKRIAKHFYIECNNVLCAKKAIKETNGTMFYGKKIIVEPYKSKKKLKQKKMIHKNSLKVSEDLNYQVYII